MTDKNYHSKSEQETINLAIEYAKDLKDGDIVCLHGTLGAGKSVFSRAVIRALSGEPYLVVPSPTFTLVQMYETTDFPIWHFDLYRLEDPEEIYEIGWEEALSDGVLLIEWPEKLGHLLPEKYKSVNISMTGDTRTISYSSHQ